MKRLLACMALLLILTGCSELELASNTAKYNHHAQEEGTFKVGNPYKVEGEWYYPKEQYTYSETGIASWYGPGFNGHHTANGEVYDANELTAAHRTLQMPSLVRVTNLDNGKSVIVRVNDRGPYRRGRVMDVSSKAADLLGFKGSGTAKVRLDLLPRESMQIAAAARSGLSTKGYEIAANQGTYAINTGPVYTQAPPVQLASAAPPGAVSATPLQDYPAGPDATVAAALQPVQQETESMVETPASAKTGETVAVPGHTRYGQFYPDPIVTEMPVKSTGIYIQAGAFANSDNANALSAKLSAAFQSAKVEPADVNGKHLFRVRIGPVENVQAGDALLTRVVGAGYKNAIIIVE
jgi:rare lipoprotein A